MNVTQATTEVRARGFDFLPDERILIMLNDGKNALEDEWEFPWLLTSITGPAPLVIPDLKYVLSVNGGELPGIDIRQVGATAPVDPAWYLGDDTQDETTMRTYPGSTTDLTVVYIRVSPELVDPTDAPLIPARHHSLWIDYTVVQAYQDSDNFQGAQLLRQDTGMRMQELITRYETRNRQHSVLNTIYAFSEDE